MTIKGRVRSLLSCRNQARKWRFWESGKGEVKILNYDIISVPALHPIGYMISHWI